MDQNIKTLQQWINESQRIVFFGGAGVSTESGIPDFRSVDGLYNQSYAYPPKPSSATLFLPRTRRSSTGSTGRRCSSGGPSPTPPT